jgi:CHAT domain-containing protein
VRQALAVEALAERLLTLEDGAEREELLTAAANRPEIGSFLLQSAREQMGGNAGEASRRAQVAAVLAERADDGVGAAQAWRLIGQARRVHGDHAEAVTALETAAARARQAGDGRLAAQVQIGRVDSLNWLGRYDEAIALARRLETELRGYGEETDAAKVLVNLGALYYRRDQYAAALACYERAAETFARSGEPIAEATVQTNVAAVLMELHRVDEAIALFEQARTAFAAHSMLTPAAKIDANVGFLHYLSGRYAQAVAALERAREEFTARGQTLDAAKCDADVAEAYRALNLYPEAQEAYARATVEMEARGVAYERARVELGRASVYLALEQPAEALEALERAAELFSTHRNATQQAHVRLMRARLLLQAGRREEARQEAARAARTLTRNGLRGWAAEARLLLAEMAAEEGDDVSRALHAVRRAARATARGWLECRTERALGRHYLSAGKTGRGLHHLQAGVEALEQARTLIAPEEMHVSFLRDKLAIYEETVGALLARGRRQDIARALEYVERAKSRLLLERVQAALEARPLLDGALSPPLQARLASLRAELSRGYHRLNALDETESRRVGVGSRDDAVSLNALEQEYAALLRREEHVSHPQTGLLSLPEVVTTAELSAQVGDNEALLVYYTIGGALCVWIVTPQQVHFRPDIACLDEVNHAARRLRFQLQRVGGASELPRRHAQRFEADAQAVLAHLYDLLLRPIADLLTAEQIVIVPHASLHGLPFHACFDGERHAVDRWEISYAPSAALWHRGALRQRTDPTEAVSWSTAKALLVSVPSPGIEQVTEEVSRLARLLPQASVLHAEEATLEAVRGQAAECRLLHLATHALYRADNPLFSGLQLADGWLLARDLYAMRLPSDLATLSACQTGVATADAGDELFGLLRGFLAAGVRSVAASLWPADDQATAALMQAFYARLLEGRSKASALRGAQQATRALFPHPYHWAAFALVGERGSNVTVSA